MTRVVHHSYRDPLELIWLEAAKRIGLRIGRSDEVFASSDGRGGVTIAGGEHLDADDCLAQMIFHELCHSLVGGPESFEIPDWGLENAGDPVYEHACLRAQAHLSARFGLRRVLAPTTDFRAFYDSLEDDPIGDRLDESTRLAIAAIGRADKKPWAPHLAEALEATATIARAGSAMWADDSLFASVGAPIPLHQSGLNGGFVAGRTCGDCAWLDSSKSCVVAKRQVSATEEACDRFEAVLDCDSCGACCREGYGSVTVDESDPVVAAHPELIAHRDDYIELLRDGPRCAALRGEPYEKGTPFRCAIYDDRPRCCRELERGGEHCLSARRRVGLSI